LSRQHYGTELSEVSIALAEIHNDLRAVEARLERNRLRAPFDGVVHNLISSRPGAVVEQGQPLLELVPAHGTLIAEISIPTTEIAHVRIGQQARIAIDGVEPQRHGYIIGRLAQLSPSTFVHAEDRPYYRGRINFDLTQPDDVVGRHLVPGMTITAEINIGERTILEYMLKPIYRAWNQAFHER
jgi:HlyD family type I secretion membrane fusion protein